MHTPSKSISDRGDTVYLKCDGDKHKSRELYVVKAVDGNSVTIIKLLHADNSK